MTGMIGDFALGVQYSAIPLIIFRLHTGGTTVGRSTRCDIVIKHVSVSRRHAELRFDGQNISLCDLQSRNGTYVNDVRVSVAEINEGDRLRFGSVRASIMHGHTDHHEDDFDLSTPIFQSESETAEIRHELLSNAQLPVFDCLLRGMSEKEIATELHISVHTVHNHVQKIHRIYGVRSGRELLARFVHVTAADLGMASMTDSDSHSHRQQP